MKKHIYECITGSIVAELEHGVGPWLKLWNAKHAAGRITRLLRHSGAPYHGNNVLVLGSGANLELTSRDNCIASFDGLYDRPLKLLGGRCIHIGLRPAPVCPGLIGISVALLLALEV